MSHQILSGTTTRTMLLSKAKLSSSSSSSALLSFRWRRSNCFLRRGAAAGASSEKKYHGRIDSVRWISSTHTRRSSQAESAITEIQQQHENESFLTGTSSVYAEQMYELYLMDRNSVHTSWRTYFDNMENGIPYNPTEYMSPTIVPSTSPSPSSAGSGSTSPAIIADGTPAPSDSLGVAHLIRAYQMNGHLAAKLDPLGLHNEEAFPHRPRPPLSAGATDVKSTTTSSAVTTVDGEDGQWYPPELTLEYHGFNSAVDLDRRLNFRGTSSGGNKGYLEELASRPDKVTLRMILNELRKTYCNTLGVEYNHITENEKQNWIREKIENPKWVQYDKSKKEHIYERLCFADTFENFLATKFNTTKRFGLDGGESIIPALKDCIDRASELGAHSFVIGMPHRGRLNVLANVMRKPMQHVFAEFHGTDYTVKSNNIKRNRDYDSDDEIDTDWSMSGDVKYHLGSSMDRKYPDGRSIHLSLVANPSHLECVNPVVIGKTRAKQYYCGNRLQDIKQVVPILLHGDAAFAGQGVVYETLQMKKIPDFHVGGTIHVIINNQIGFTTNPIHSRSTPYCSDLGKAFNIPIFHCNGDDPLAVSTALETAVEYRNEWNHDVIIDMVCYRRNGHNELDQPAFTQPKLYKAINRHPSTLQIFEKRLIDEGTMTAKECDDIKKMVLEMYEHDYEAAKTYKKKETDWLSSRWEGFKGPGQMSRIRPTGVDIDVLRKIGIQSGTVPPDFKLHRQMAKIFKARIEMAEKGEGIDWGTAEAMAFGSLLLEGNHVRITGQDVQRGTFSHRHAVVKDQNTEQEFTPLNSLAKNLDPSAPMEELSKPDTQAGFTCRNSILSEFAVLGFEHGYSLENPNSLIVWEAQFGDFVNGAQIMVDQFISSGEDKWLRQSGLVMLLPHGYDGQGAEHSSCRVERFLQQVDEDPHYIPRIVSDTTERMQIQRCNLQIVNCTTPANYFHCLRRQIHRDFRKPLIVVAPKNLLRNKRCISRIEDMGPGTMFRPVIDEIDNKIIDNSNEVTKLVFCTGQIYYELLAEREKRGITNVALVRLEQIAPFCFDRVADNVRQYPNAEIIWAQQEPKNMGCFSYILPRIRTATRELLGKDKEQRPRYVGRAVSAAPATGMSKVHQMEYQIILDSIYGTTNEDAL